MPFETKMTEQAIEKLKNLYGTDITADIKAFCAMNDITYQTVTKKLQNFKVAKGKESRSTVAAVENIEKSYNSPAVIPASEKNLVPAVDETFLNLETFRCKENYTIKTILSYIITGYLATVKHLVLSKHVLS